MPTVESHVEISKTRNFIENDEFINNRGVTEVIGQDHSHLELTTLQNKKGSVVTTQPDRSTAVTGMYTSAPAEFSSPTQVAS